MEGLDFEGINSSFEVGTTSVKAGILHCKTTAKLKKVVDANTLYNMGGFEKHDWSAINFRCAFEIDHIANTNPHPRSQSIAIMAEYRYRLPITSHKTS